MLKQGEFCFAPVERSPGHTDGDPSAIARVCLPAGKWTDMEAHGCFISIRQELGLETVLCCQEVTSPEAVAAYLDMCHEIAFLFPRWPS